MELTTARVVSMCVASFAVGFNLCNLIWLFFSPKGIRKDRHKESGDTDRDGAHGYHSRGSTA